MTRRTIGLACVWTLPGAICVIATAAVFSSVRIPPPERLGPAERTQVLATLRAAFEDQPAAPPAVQRSIPGPVAVTVWSGGRAVARADGTGGDVAAATMAAAARLRELAAVRALSTDERARARLQVDIVTGTGPLGGGPLLRRLAMPGIGDLLAVNPGVEGIGAELAGKPVMMLPHELVAAKLVTARRPSPALPEVATVVERQRILQALAARAGVTLTSAPTSLYRFRTDTFVEAPDRAAAPIALVRGLPPAPRLSAQTLREAALRGGRYLVAHLGPNGRYVYEHDLTTGVASDATKLGASYSIPRHAGTTYFLAELYRITRQDGLREPIVRALAHLADLVGQGGCGGTLPDGTAFDCVLDRGQTVASLGSTALAVVALAEYQRATGEPRYLPLATKLAAWILYMQRADGSFRHLYDARARAPDETTQLLYYSGEAALALARMHAITGEARYAVAAERALDRLIGWYDFFMAGFFYGEEHWTCIAAEALWPAARHDRYRAFCDGYAGFLRSQQAEHAADSDAADYGGAYQLTPFLAPQNTPAGSRTEAMISAYLLGKHHGAPDVRVAAQITAALQYALGQQIRPDSHYNVIGEGDGAIPATPINRNIRIDYVQHVCSAMIRASEWVDGER
jgi:hypothetical protein